MLELVSNVGDATTLGNPKDVLHHSRRKYVTNSIKHNKVW
jgi:hypothetical protein